MYKLPTRRTVIDTFPPFDFGVGIEDRHLYFACANRTVFFLQPSAQHRSFWWFYKIDAGGWEGFLRPMRGEAVILLAERIVPSDLVWHWEPWDGLEYEPPQNELAVTRSDTIYFAEAAGLGRVKIGLCTGHPQARIENLQVGSPVKLRLLAFLRGNSKTERSLHLQFASLRIHGEWFRLEPPLQSYIQSLKGQYL